MILLVKCKPGTTMALQNMFFTVQQQLFSIQAGSKIAEAAGLSTLEVSVQAVGDAMKTALENGTALTINSVTEVCYFCSCKCVRFFESCIWAASIVNTTNQKIAAGYNGMAVALSDQQTKTLYPCFQMREQLLLPRRCLFVHYRNIFGIWDARYGSFLALDSVIAENSAVFGTVTGRSRRWFERFVRARQSCFHSNKIIGTDRCGNTRCGGSFLINKHPFMNNSRNSG